MSIVEGVIPTKADVELFNVVVILAEATTTLTSALRDLFDADDLSRAERFDLFCAADKHAEDCAFTLKGSYPNASKIIQNLRMAVTLASLGRSPSEVLAARERKSDERSKTYIAINPESGLMKIGRSGDPASRMRGLQTGAAIKPELLAVIDADVERELHKRFKSLRVFGEWFRDDGSISAFIAEQAQL